MAQIMGTKAYRMLRVHENPYKNPSVSQASERGSCTVR
jgi:hypothetical protein